MNQTLTNTIGAALIITGTLTAQSAGAAERGFYVGVYYGQTDKASEEGPYVALANRNYQSFGFNPQSTEDSFDAKDVSYGFFGGFRISEHWAVEGGFMELGEVAYKDVSTGVDHSQDQVDDTGSIDHSGDAIRTWDQQISSSSRGLSVAALGIWPITYRSEIYAKGGIVLSNSELNIRLSNGTDSASNNPQQKTSFDVLVGAGAAFTFAEIYSIRLEYQRIFDQGDESSDEHDMDILSLGVTVTF